MSAEIDIQPYLALLEDGAAAYVATRDAGQVPDSALLAGGSGAADPGVLTIFLPDSQGRTTLDNLEDNRQVAVCITRLADYRTYQLKGHSRAVRRATDAERELIERQHEAFAAGADVEDLGHVVRSWDVWPCTAIEVVVREVFAQTPGPGTGKRIGG